MTFIVPRLQEIQEMMVTLPPEGPPDLMDLLEQQQRTWMLKHVAIIEIGNKVQGLTLTVATSTL